MYPRFGLHVVRWHISELQLKPLIPRRQPTRSLAVYTRYINCTVTFFGDDALYRRWLRLRSVLSRLMPL